MFDFAQQFETDEHDKAFALCSSLQSFANELGIETGIMLAHEMQTEQLQSVQAMLAEIIEANYEARKEDFRRLKRCPQGFEWDREGTGWRCQGGSHYCSAEEIKAFMD